LGFSQNRGELPKNKLAFLEALLKGTIHDSEWPKVLFKLTEILHVPLHEEKVVILIDEYDSPSSVCLSSGQTDNIYISFTGK